MPFTLVSPWSGRNYVSHRLFDHASILKLVETKWNLPALTFRDANAMLDMLDLAQALVRRAAAPGDPDRGRRPLVTDLRHDRPGHDPAPDSITG